VDFGRCPVRECLVGPPLVVESQIPVDTQASLPRRGILVQVHLFVLDRALQPLREHVVERPALAVHADRHARRLEPLDVLRARSSASSTASSTNPNSGVLAVIRSQTEDQKTAVLQLGREWVQVRMFLPEEELRQYRS